MPLETRRPGESALLLLDAVRLFEAMDVRYAVIGAMAASIHGVVRASLDADALLSVPTHRLDELEQAFRAAGFQTELRRGDPDDPIAAVLALTDSFENRVDLLVGLRGVDPALFSRTITVEFHGRPLHIVGLEDFIAMKIFAGAPQDLSDARHALAVGGDALDAALLRRTASRYGKSAAAALEKLLAEKPAK
ncbi:MAG TPA: hypothetical protein VFV10_12855 [Gammaproteobacteria bacterium]|nr:hypothetical protein [Gammaproteobacteria bacterium]